MRSDFRWGFSLEMMPRSSLAPRPIPDRELAEERIHGGRRIFAKGPDLNAKKNPQRCADSENQSGGGGWIRTIEGMAGRFTVYCI